MDSAVIVLIPDAKYVKARPKTADHHLTLAYYGLASEISPEGKSRLRNLVQHLGQSARGTGGTANGIGIFDAGATDGFAVVDLIDGNDTSLMRQFLQSSDTLDGATINKRHGFMPHMTREFVLKEDDVYAEISPDMIDNIKFKWAAVGLWMGDERFEVSL